MNLISLPETKNYLRVDHCEDDKLILQLLDTAKSLVKDVGRMDEEKFTIDAAYVDDKLSDIVVNRDLSQYIL